jgi:hypothetical protein
MLFVWFAWRKVCECRHTYIDTDRSSVPAVSTRYSSTLSVLPFICLSHLHFVSCNQFPGFLCSLSLSLSLSVSQCHQFVTLSLSPPVPHIYMYPLTSLQLNVSILQVNMTTVTFTADNKEGTDRPKNSNKMIQSVASSVSVPLTAVVLSVVC